MKVIVNAKYKNILNYESFSDAEINFQSVPYDKDNNYKDTNKSNVFADNGSWHGYYLPKKNNLSSFAGPLVLSQEIPINIGPYSNKLILNYKNEILNFNDSKKNIFSLPGKLILNYEFDDFIVNKELIFSDNRTALIETKIKNKTSNKIEIDLGVEGSFYSKVKTKSSNNVENKLDWVEYFNEILNKKDEILIFFNPLINKNVIEKMKIKYSEEIKDFFITKDKNEIIFSCYFGKKIIMPNSTFYLSSFESFTFDDVEKDCSFDLISNYKKDNENRWNKYIENILHNNKNKKYEKLLIKSLQTLISNWRSPAGVLKKNFIIPSITYQDFIGAWSWDTWKIVVGVAEFDTNLAQECLESLFDFQINSNDFLRPQDEGMIPDCIFFNYSKSRGGVGINWNERNTKPPIAAWAVNKIYEISKDISFLKRIYPKIKAYNNWWNNNRSLNKNNILQYGGTVDYKNNFADPKTIVESAAWESGMDNAPRFDWDKVNVEKVFQDNKLIGYVIDQISVDLNSFNYLDFISLIKLAKILNYQSDVIKFGKYANNIKIFVNKYMYDDKTKFYYDIKSINMEKVTLQGKGMEGIMPLFVKLATKNNAIDIIDNINEKNYNQFIPFPSVSIDNKGFDATDYWRGPVWIDQFYFGVKAIKNYGYDHFSKSLAVKGIDNMEGLLSDLTIRENYNPLNGDGLSTTNFSWSASTFIIIVKNIINK